MYEPLLLLLLLLLCLYVEASDTDHLLPKGYGIQSKK